MKDSEDTFDQVNKNGLLYSPASVAFETWCEGDKELNYMWK